ncbi:MAG: pseudaminic acid biosynthesis-associated methylase [Gammaproteobacteria bacterium RIFCSPHIGHO2_12_FULL_36_30]|nr:MAG: pseudaminic acid biosynthesis-associated methylase [Gammaproteobacteria bacterium RIFCSPHIGHO2_12_FULL_36_30]
MKNFATEQEKFWAGDFGISYAERNDSLNIAASNLSFFSKVFASTKGIKSVLEFGSNIGLNLTAIQQLIPDVELSAIEINEKAVLALKKNGISKIYHQSILEFELDYQRDFVLSKGVLIHINPDYLQRVYDTIYQSSSKYICIAEYYNPTPVEIPYRGWSEKLYKRDFAGEMLDKYKELKLINYGFCYRRDNLFPCDDLTWFLLKK